MGKTSSLTQLLNLAMEQSWMVSKRPKVFVPDALRPFPHGDNDHDFFRAYQLLLPD
jgi:hypothetical protein